MNITPKDERFASVSGRGAYLSESRWLFMMLRPEDDRPNLILRVMMPCCGMVHAIKILISIGVSIHSIP
jgi:hypothetical protein